MSRFSADDIVAGFLIGIALITIAVFAALYMHQLVAT